LYAKIVYPVFGRILYALTGLAPIIDSFVASREEPIFFHPARNLYFEEKRGANELTDWRDHEDSLKICDIAAKHFEKGDTHVFFWLGYYYPIQGGIRMQRALYVALPVKEHTTLRGIEMRMLHESSMPFTSIISPRWHFGPIATPLIAFGEWLVWSSFNNGPL